MTEITRCNRIGFHYNGFLNVLDNSNPAYNAKSSIKIFKKIYFCSNCGTWVNFEDISFFAENWLTCNKPGDADCIENW